MSKPTERTDISLAFDGFERTLRSISGAKITNRFVTNAVLDSAMDRRRATRCARWARETGRLIGRPVVSLHFLLDGTGLDGSSLRGDQALKLTLQCGKLTLHLPKLFPSRGRLIRSGRTGIGQGG